MKFTIKFVMMPIEPRIGCKYERKKNKIEATATVKNRSDSIPYKYRDRCNGNFKEMICATPEWPVNFEGKSTLLLIKNNTRHIISIIIN